jgi:DNA-3-methyladenine glycosylase II
MAEATATFEIAPSGPFDLANQNRYFGGWPVIDGAVVMAFPVEGWSGSASVALRQSGISVIGEVHTAGADAERAWSQALSVLSLDFDGQGFAELGRRDPVIGRLQEQYSFLRPVLFHSPYEAAAGFTIGHRLSILQARRIRAQLAEALGDAIDAGGQMLHAFPQPQRLLEQEQLQHVAGAKVERLHAIARAATDGWLDRARLRSMSEEDALAKLETLPGIGPFFSQGILMRGAGLADSLPDDDLTTRAIRAACDLPESAGVAEVRERAEAWRPYRMWCCVMLHVWYRSQPGIAQGLRGGASERGRRPRPRR